MGEFQSIQKKRGKIISIVNRHGLRNIRIFGSVARGEETPLSDIDFLVDIDKGCTIFDLSGANVQLQALLGRKVDIVTENGLHWYLRDKILREARPL